MALLVMLEVTVIIIRDLDLEGPVLEITITEEGQLFFYFSFQAKCNVYILCLISN